ncbi:MAG: hypothetical protein V3R84_06790 [Acidimicrobiia bacterium]
MSRYRLVYLGLALALVAVIGATWALSSDGEPRSLPAVVELIAPAPDATVSRQASVVVDMIVGYSIELTIDGVTIPASELVESPALIRFEWTPGTGQSFTEWVPGSHEVHLSWNAAVGLPDIGSYSWAFRSQ